MFHSMQKQMNRTLEMMEYIFNGEAKNTATVQRVAVGAQSQSSVWTHSVLLDCKSSVASPQTHMSTSTAISIILLRNSVQSMKFDP